MYKLLLIVLMMTVWLSIHLLQVEEELAMHTLFQGKHAVNRSAHAAAQQLDSSALAEGVLRLAPDEASGAASLYLRENLKLDEDGTPLPQSFLKHPVKVVVFELVNDEHAFPYTYRNAAYHYEVTLTRPGVIMIVHMVYPRAFQVMEPIEWYIKGAAELVAG
ncbi:hypothetical protein BK133_11990 [Paenibacillus sp. FSL H8-0548]|uniref:hypothetical protein n=1 Tax=Paenibacillus sp. FSL H8-0548 TaxID=1920422 RepID=UPI00096E6313|nr:hypothetical protein [Paenibacillus sp. FSL H8-0548]OMF34720.1 hypothetical protein BK133_11990 [Paenibacillus sp. FSL H8-0548]